MSNIARLAIDLSLSIFDTLTPPMITPAFTKLQRAILTSSIWLQNAETRLVWITILALCDRDGIARCSPMGLAHQARVDPSACESAIEILLAPDPDSRDLGDGRRIERVPGGFFVINYKRTLGEGAREQRREYNREKKRESRARKRANGGTIRPEHVLESDPDPNRRPISNRAPNEHSKTNL
jgi:hypothetical protein